MSSINSRMQENQMVRRSPERRVPLEGAVNFRDIGGYPAKGGRCVRWGKVFRSDGLSRLTVRDQHVLKDLGVGRVFDFRTLPEVLASPDRLPEDGAIVWEHAPVMHGDIDYIIAMKRLKQGDVSWLTPDFMVKGYIRNLDVHGRAWGRVINYLAQADGHGVVFHCTGGKDRTGTCAALLLRMLGVDEETVIADHQLSNDYLLPHLPALYAAIRASGIDPLMLAPYFTAPREGIVAMLAHLREHYGSAADYLEKKAGVKKETQELLKEKLLR